MPLDRSTPVLLVDEPTITTIIGQILGGLGFHCIDTAADGPSALNSLRESGPRLVIADLHMEPMSGLSLLRAVRSDEMLKRSPFIMTMAKLVPAEAVAIKHAGADGFIVKPFTRAALGAKVQEVLANRAARGQAGPSSMEGMSASLERRLSRR